MIESETGDFICYKKCGFFVKLDKKILRHTFDKKVT